MHTVHSTPRTSTPNRIHVLLVDDHPAIREAIAATLDNKMDIEVVAQAGTADEALHRVEETQPDVVIVDISLEDAHGLDLVQNIRAQYENVQVIVFSMYDEHVYAERAIRAGAAGYLMKSEPTQAVVEAVRTAARGEVYLSRPMATRLLSMAARGRSSGPSFMLDELTDREMAVFQFLGEGYSVDDISDQLHLSRKTVETYRRRAKEKLGYETVTELLQHAVQWSLSHRGGPRRATYAPAAVGVE